MESANRLDKALRNDSSLGWFVSIFPPNRPRPVPLMSLKLPPLPAAYISDQVQYTSKTLQPKPTDRPFLGGGKRIYSHRIDLYSKAQIIPTPLC